MRKIKRVKIGEYVLVSRWGDRSLYDPWFIGHISEFGEDDRGLYYKVKEDTANRYWRYVHRITPEEAEERFRAVDYLS